jgi:hypothetical protein
LEEERKGLADHRLLLSGGQLELEWEQRLREGKSVKLCCIATNPKTHNNQRVSLALHCKPAVALLEAVDLWDTWGSSSVPGVIQWLGRGAQLFPGCFSRGQKHEMPSQTTQAKDL